MTRGYPVAKGAYSSMHITLEADYAVRIVEMLSKSDRRQEARTIAEETQVPLRFCLKILRNLVAAGLVKSFKGAKGGYQLADQPCNITLRQVIEAVEGPYCFSRCLDGEFPCARAREGGCRFHGVYDDISLMVRKKLDSVTFASKEKTT